MELLFLNIGSNEIIVLLIFGVLGLAPLVLAIWALIDVFKRDFRHKSTDRLLITILVVFAPLVGSIIYFLLLRDKYPVLAKTVR